ncbi:MAG TPA: proline dehydrogenase family protein [Parafilimonas sp.]|nr:proline dehydrogenase family protein [Parafilimonas sp.]
MRLSFNNTETAFAYKTSKELNRGRFLFGTMNYPWFAAIGVRLTPFLMKTGLPVHGIIRQTIFKQFVGGETLEETSEIAKKLGEYDVQVILDYGVEAKQGEKNFDETKDQIIHNIEYAATQPNIPYISIKITGIARFGLLETLNSAPRLRSGVHDHEAEDAEWNRVRDRMYDICEKAAEKNVGVLIDAEESWIQDPIDRLSVEMMEVFNREQCIVFNTIQLYRHDRLNFLKMYHSISRQRGFILGLKLVRGAYMEKERARAVQMGYPSPIQQDKSFTDGDFNTAVEYCIDNINEIATVIATHNEYSNLHAAELLDAKGLPHNHRHIHFSQLYGMSDNITFNLAKAGYSVSKYLPFGPIRDVIPYLMRRAQENSSINGQTSRELLLIKSELKRRKVKTSAQKRQTQTEVV